jgi:hypothetical protein
MTLKVNAMFFRKYGLMPQSPLMWGAKQAKRLAWRFTELKARAGRVLKPAQIQIFVQKLNNLAENYCNLFVNMLCFLWICLGVIQ